LEFLIANDIKEDAAKKILILDNKEVMQGISFWNVGLTKLTD